MCVQNPCFVSRIRHPVGILVKLLLGVCGRACPVPRPREKRLLVRLRLVRVLVARLGRPRLAGREVDARVARRREAAARRGVLRVEERDGDGRGVAVGVGVQEAVEVGVAAAPARELGEARVEGRDRHARAGLLRRRRAAPAGALAHVHALVDERADQLGRPRRVGEARQQVRQRQADDVAVRVRPAALDGRGEVVQQRDAPRFFFSSLRVRVQGGPSLARGPHGRRQGRIDGVVLIGDRGQVGRPGRRRRGGSAGGEVARRQGVEVRVEPGLRGEPGAVRARESRLRESE